MPNKEKKLYTTPVFTWLSKEEATQKFGEDFIKEIEQMLKEKKTAKS